MRKTFIVAVLFAVAAFLSFTSFAEAETAVLGFDDITPVYQEGDTSHYYVIVPYGYGGLNWDYTWGSGFQADTGHYAFDDGIISPSYAAVIGGGTATVWAPEGTFDFIGAYMTGGWYSGIENTVQGYLGEELIYSETFTTYNDNPIYYEFNYTGIDKLIFPGQDANMDFVMDNFTYNTVVVPEPISSTLFLIGGAILGFRRFRKIKN